MDKNNINKNITGSVSDDINDLIPPKQNISSALKNVLKKHPNIPRKELIELSLKQYGFSDEQLKDRSCESLNTKLKSITGVVINEMLQKNTLACDENRIFFLPPEVLSAMQAAPKAGTAEKASSAEAPAGGANAADVKSTGNDSVQTSGQSPAPSKRRRGGHGNAAKKAHSKYPDNNIGKLLETADKKYESCKDGKITAHEYNITLRRLLMQCINEAGGEAFEELCMRLLLGIFGDRVITHKLTAGPDDNGIDGRLTVRDELGFEEEIFFQSKTKKIKEKQKEEDSHIPLFVVRGFLGVMTAFGASKGAVMTTANFHRDTKKFADKAKNLALIDSAALFALMCKSGIGVKSIDGVFHIEDDFFLSRV